MISHRPVIGGHENSDPENSDLRPQTSDPENADPKNSDPENSDLIPRKPNVENDC